MSLKEPGLSERKRFGFVRLLIQWHKENRRLFPWRKNQHPYRVLIAEILLQRTPANRVSTFFPHFVDRFPEPQSIMSTSVQELEQFLKPMGLKKRAYWLVKLMKDICEKHNCKIPDKEDELTHLPGVGRYTARAVLSFGFKKDVAIVDINVARVLSRVFGLSERKRQPHADTEIWTLASLLVPKGKGPEYNEALLDFAALVCGKTPFCHICPINENCEYYSALQKKLNM